MHRVGGQLAELVEGVDLDLDLGEVTHAGDEPLFTRAPFAGELVRLHEAGGALQQLVRWPLMAW